MKKEWRKRGERRERGRQSERYGLNRQKAERGRHAGWSSLRMLTCCYIVSRTPNIIANYITSILRLVETEGG